MASLGSQAPVCQAPPEHSCNKPLMGEDSLGTEREEKQPLPPGCVNSQRRQTQSHMAPAQDPPQGQLWLLV